MDGSSGASIEDFCVLQLKNKVDFSTYPANTREFLANLGLSSLHPGCIHTNGSNYWPSDDIVPQMGPAEIDFIDLHDGSLWSALVTQLYMFVPKFLVFWFLWFLVFAPIIAPLGCLYLIGHCNASSDNMARTTHAQKSNDVQKVAPPYLSFVCTMTVASSLAILKDLMYVHDFRVSYGTALFLFSSFLVLRTCIRYQLHCTRRCLLMFWIAASVLPSYHDQESVNEGLYYDKGNPLVHRIVSLLGPELSLYSRENGATAWMYTGDVRTGLPFFLNKITEPPNWVRVWLPTETPHDREVIALDISFPAAGHNDAKPVYLLLHGLSGGSSEGYLLDLTTRRNRQGSTVIAMIARGMMGKSLLVFDCSEENNMSTVLT